MLTKSHLPVPLCLSISTNRKMAKYFILSITIYTIIQMFEVESSLLCFYYDFKITVFSLNIFKHVIYSCDAKLNFHQPLLQASVSHDPSEIILICTFAA